MAGSVIQRSVRTKNNSEYRQVSEKFLPKTGARTVSLDVKARLNSTPLVRISRVSQHGR